MCVCRWDLFSGYSVATSAREATGYHVRGWHALQKYRRRSFDAKNHGMEFRLWIIIISLFVAGTVVAVVIGIGIQRHNDQQLGAQMIRSELELRTTEAEVLRTMN